MSNTSLTQIVYGILLFIVGFSSYSQNINGKVSDTLQNPLPYANILAIPDNDNQEVKFAITENDCSYKLGLVAKIYSV